MNTTQINAFIKRNWKWSYDQLSKKTGISKDAVRKRYYSMKLPAKEKEYVGKEESLGDFVYEFLKKSHKDKTLSEISDYFDCGISKVKEALDLLKKQGKNLRIAGEGISLSGEIERSKPSVIHLPKNSKVIRFGFVTDNHLCSRYERLDVLNALYDLYKREGIETVYNGGNMIDGEARFNKFDIHTYGMENQCKYLAKVYPQRKGIKTLFVTGDDHEGWYVQREGIEIGKFIEQKAHEVGRDDLVYLGHMEHDIVLKAKSGFSVMRLLHAGGGSSYATSYAAQKIVESYQGGEKPHVLLIGHYHKAEYGYPREVHCLQGGATMDQSPFMRKKKLQAHVGGWIVEIHLNDDGSIQRFKPEFIPFYDKSFYDKAWKYQW